MDMINLREAPLVDKPEDGATLFALNVDGTVNRIKADGVGGGGKVAVIKVGLGMESAASPAAEGIAQQSQSFSCTCDTMTFEEAKAIVLAGEKLDAIVMTDGRELGQNSIVLMYTASAVYEKSEVIPSATDTASTNESIYIYVISIMTENMIKMEVNWNVNGITVRGLT